MIVLACVFVVVRSLAVRDMRAPPPPLPPQEAELGSRVKAFAAAREVRRFRAEHGRLPTSLAEVGPEDAGLTLVVEGTRWRIADVVNGEIVEAGSEEDPMSVILEMADDPPPGPGGME